MGQGAAAFIYTMDAYITRIGEESGESGAFPSAMPLLHQRMHIWSSSGK